MKTLLILTALFLASCSKPALESNRVAAVASSYVSSVTFFREYPGGRTTTGISYTLSNLENISSVSLIRNTPFAIFKIKDPKEGRQVLHDSAEYPTYAQSRFYQFEIVLKDGTKILGEPFQVY